ncbi:hypothetical protein O2N63_09000 [Aliiroseovarius sp. KMU-50]|uniref:Transmembrane protein n=1 Tax=Aliiroseovarius salicola TaxID=3009082 RepID=A0ABT4W2M0_9RHOB|nr:hypothetical protein [Aliiroseovarius sp. KMU-50]MDA5094225.1 hypothetical protein [Aliiroseovarius sp. KMU-50]
MPNMDSSSKLGFVITTLLAWLGLAGFIDAIIEWQNWFEQGVMEHWRSTKVWIATVLFWWFPIPIPSWAIDYCVIGGIVIRAKPPMKWAVPDGFNMSELKLSERVHVFASRCLNNFPKDFAIFLLWPLYLLFVFVLLIAPKPNGLAVKADFKLPNGDQPPDVWISQNEIIMVTRQVHFRLLWYFASFIPFLFVVSKLLYEFG